MFEAKIDDTADRVSASQPGEHPPATRNRPQSLKPILVVLHQEHSTPAHVGRTLVAQGHKLDIRKPRFGDPLPATLEHHDGAVIFGGPMSANDPDDFIKQETDWIGVALEENKPFLGICLGAQMLANHLGARVFRDTDGHVEIGYHPIAASAGPASGIDWPDRVFQWHKEGFDLPSGATCLARADGRFPCQAFVYGSALSVQFHPEITYQQVNRWSGRNPWKLEQPGAQDRPGQLRDHIALAPGIHRWLDALLWQWKSNAVR
jgi:GMP synthase (glutamine-hydrolysing)